MAILVILSTQLFQCFIGILMITLIFSTQLLNSVLESKLNPNCQPLTRCFPCNAETLFQTCGGFKPLSFSMPSIALFQFPISISEFRYDNRFTTTNKNRHAWIFFFKQFVKPFQAKTVMGLKEDESKPLMAPPFQIFELSRILKWTIFFFLLTSLVIGLLQIELGVIPWDLESRNDEMVSRSNDKSCSGFFNGDSFLISGAKKVVSITDFGGVGDGKTLNTGAFRKAVEFLKPFAQMGNWVQLNVPNGRWLTGSFNLTSNFVLFLHKDAVILGSQNISEWPLIEPLPSYGRGRERPGGRHISLIHGDNLQNVIIKGENGSIDGQGSMWWQMWFNRTLEHTRGHLIEFINSENILILNITFRNSPFWNIHPVYCRNVVIKEVTILAPLNAPNTDGIDADSSSNFCIEECYIESGDDLVAIKSGWDEYGIAFGRPSSNVIVQRVSGTTPTCSGIGIGSEMSGGIKDVIVRDIKIKNAAAGIRVKTDVGRGGYVKNITISHVYMENVKIPIKFSTHSNDHPDDKWSRSDIPIVRGISIRNVKGRDIHSAPSFKGLQESPFANVWLEDIRLEGIPQRRMQWQCENVEGVFWNVSPLPCFSFQRKTNHSSYSSDMQIRPSK